MNMQGRIPASLYLLCWMLTWLHANMFSPLLWSSSSSWAHLISYRVWNWAWGLFNSHANSECFYVKGDKSAIQILYSFLRIVSYFFQETSLLLSWWQNYFSLLVFRLVHWLDFFLNLPAKYGKHPMPNLLSHLSCHYTVGYNVAILFPLRTTVTQGWGNSLLTL